MGKHGIFFTQHAAERMQERLPVRVGGLPRYVWIKERISEAIDAGLLSPAAPGWLQTRGTFGVMGSKWVATAMGHVPVAILLAPSGRSWRVVTVVVHDPELSQNECGQVESFAQRAR